MQVYFRDSLQWLHFFEGQYCNIPTPLKNSYSRSIALRTLKNGVHECILRLFTSRNHMVRCQIVPTSRKNAISL